MPNASFAGELAKSHLCDQPRFDEMRAALRQHQILTDPKWRHINRDRFQFLMNRLERLAIETGADFSHVAELSVILINPEQQRAEMIARAVRAGVSADDEAPGLRGFDLEPLRGARPAISGVALLGNDTLESRIRDRLKEILTASDDMVAVTNRPFAAHHAMKNLFALLQRHLAKIETVEGEQIENEIHRGSRETQLARGGRIAYVHPALQHAEVRPPFVIERDDFAIDHEAIKRHRVECQRHLRISRRHLGPAARVEPHMSPVTD